MNDNKSKILALVASLLALVVEELQSTEAPAAPAPTPPRRGTKPTLVEDPEPEAPAEPEPEPEAPAVDLSTLRELASNLMAEGRKPEVVAVLKKFKVAALKELPAKNYLAVRDALQELIDNGS